MPLPTSLPYGMRDCKVTPYLNAGATQLSNTSYDLPYMQTFSFSEAEEFTELRGDDKVVTTRGRGSSVEWETESGGLPLEIANVLVGGVIDVTGTGSTEVRKFTKKASDTRPFFRIEGQILSDSGGDVHCVIDRARVTGEFSGEFSDGEFFTTGLSGVGLPSLLAGREDILYEMVQNAVAKAIPGVTQLVPIISTITPSGQGANSYVVINGVNMTGATQVMFGATAGTSLLVINDTTLQVRLPAGSAGTVNVVVTNPSGDSAPVPYTRIV